MYLAAVALLSFTRLCQGEDAYIWADNRKETSDITCWTCSDKKDNDACNDWAPDLHCPLNHTVCLTRHRFNPSSGLSVLVTKQCVQPLDCTATHVGCSLTDTGHKGLESYNLGLESYNLGLESYNLGLESYNLGLESYNLGLESYNLGLESYNLGLESYNLGLESYNLGLESYNFLLKKFRQLLGKVGPPEK
nr:hypothetical protein BaRGS_000274 [Batillaria attramentaria]